MDLPCSKEPATEILSDSDHSIKVVPTTSINFPHIEMFKPETHYTALK